MIIIGELINASRKTVGEAIENIDYGTIARLAKDQADAGSGFIDVNAGIFEDKEPDYLQWLIEIVQEHTDKPCSIDSPNPLAIEAALSVHKGTPIINSISLEKQRYEQMIPVLAGTDLKVIALCMSDEGIPQTVDDRLDIAHELIHGLTSVDIPIENIYVDPLVQPISVNTTFGVKFLDAVEKMVHAFPGVHTACGLSNIGYGLPARKVLNRVFMVMAVAKGLDAAIVDPLDKAMMGHIIAAEALMGRDEFCMRYLQAYRAGKLEM